jgi:two-component system, response regulator
VLHSTSHYILLVEDNADDIDLTRRAFEKNHIANEVVVMRDGAAARDFLFDGERQRSRGMPALILLDLSLPKVGGLELLAAIRANDATRLLPTVILTSSKQEEDLIEGYRLGVNSYVRKPVDFNEFVEAVRQVGLYWLVLNEPPPAAGGGGM